MPSNKQQTLSAPAVPTMPNPGSAYSDKNVRASNNLLRTFMLRLTGALQALFGPGGAQYLDSPNGLFFNTVDQTFAVIDTAYPVVFNQTYLNNMVGLQAGSTSRVAVTVDGVYNFQYTGQALSSNSSAKEMHLWIRRDGVDINYSTRSHTIEANDHSVPVLWGFNIDLQAGGYIEIMASVTNTNLHLDSGAAVSPYPSVPSSVLTVNYMSALPPVLPTPP
tara:strand:+ start:97 stop:756 length:660 start_codon:yes stop_codon:yes gene_type:complete